MPETDGRSPKTDDAYAKRGRQQLKRAQAKYPDAEDAVDALSQLYAQPDLTLRSSSTRTYKAAMIYTLEGEVDEGRLERQRALDGIEEISRLLIQRRGRPKPRTSRLKYLEITEEEFALISDDLRQRAEKADTLDMMLRLLLESSARTGARPSELLHARLVGRMLLVLNGKNSHGRAPGITRRIALERMSEPLLKATSCLLATIKLLVAKYGSVERVCRILSERLARVCKRLGLVRFSLYALRHVAIATWKRAGLDPIEIAALAGHISTRTAWRSYAPRPARAAPRQGLRHCRKGHH
jgi:integrase